MTAAGTLFRLALRRDRLRLPLWIVGIAGLLGATTASIDRLYPTDAARLDNAALRATSVVARAFNGPAPGPSLGALTVSEMLVFACVLAALMNILTVVRHTRQNEELGRTELIGSAVVGRHAGLAAALAVAVAADLVLAVLGALALRAAGLPTSGSIMVGVATGAAGVAFAAVTAIAAQVAEGARGALGLAGAALGVAFLLRSTGDTLGTSGPSGLTVTTAWPSWLSPIGWAQQTLPFGAQRWWPLALIAVLCVASTAIAVVLSVHRDVGTGMLPVRRGQPRARRGLLTPLGLAWYLQRGVRYSWLAGIALFGAAFGGIGDQVDELFGTERGAEVMRQLGGNTGSLVDAYFAAMMGLIGVIIAAFTVQALLRLRTDENSGGPAEAVLATAVSRHRWLAAHIIAALAGTVLVLTALGLCTGLAYGLVAGDVPGALGDLLTTTLAQLAPTLVLAGFVVAAFGLVPKFAAALSWSAFAACVVVGQLGTLFGLPNAVLDISPFRHLPNLPAESLDVAPLAVLTAVAAGLVAAGVVGFRRRSLAL